MVIGMTANNLEYYHLPAGNHYPHHQHQRLHRSTKTQYTMTYQIEIPPRSVVAPFALQLSKDLLAKARAKNDDYLISFHLGAIHRLEEEIRNIERNVKFSDN